MAKNGMGRDRLIPFSLLCSQYRLSMARPLGRGHRIPLLEDSEIVIQNICRIFERQYSLYKTTFRDGQDTAKRDFDLKKVMDLKLKMNGSETRQIKIEYGLPKAEHSFFKIHLEGIGDNAKQTEYKDKINNKTSKQLYSEDISFC